VGQHHYENCSQVGSQGSGLWDTALSYFCCGVAVYEETVTDMFMCHLSHDILILWTAFGEYCRHCVALAVGWQGDPRQRKELHRERGIPSLKSVDFRNLWVKLWKWKAFKHKYMDLSRPSTEKVDADV